MKIQSSEYVSKIWRTNWLPELILPKDQRTDSYKRKTFLSIHQSKILLNQLQNVILGDLMTKKPKILNKLKVKSGSSPLHRKLNQNPGIETMKRERGPGSNTNL